MLIDDLVCMDISRHKARLHLDEQMLKPLIDPNLFKTPEEILRENWGNSEEAIAQSESDFWDRNPQ